MLVTAAALGRFDGRLDTIPAPVYVAPKAVLAATVGFDLHRGAVAAADRRPLPSVVEVAGTARRIAVLEGLNDPENLGAVARSARALGIDALVLDPTCIDPYYRRTIRVSMGEVLHLPVARAEKWPDDLQTLRASGTELWALTPDPAAEDLWSLAVPERLAVMLGAEGPGLSAAALACADRRVRIPIRETSTRSTSATPRRSPSPCSAAHTVRGDDGTRTRNPHLAKVVRYQLRHVPEAGSHRIRGFPAPRPGRRPSGAVKASGLVG